MNVRGDAWVAEGAHENGVEVAGEHGESVGRDGGLVGEITVSTPVERSELDGGAGCFDCNEGLRDDFLANTVAGNDCNAPRGAHAGQGNRGRCQVSGLRCREEHGGCGGENTKRKVPPLRKSIRLANGLAPVGMTGCAWLLRYKIKSERKTDVLGFS